MQLTNKQTLQQANKHPNKLTNKQTPQQINKQTNKLTNKHNWMKGKHSESKWVYVTMGVCRICYCGVLKKNSLCPSRAPGFSWFFRPQNASPRIVFLLFWRQVFLQNHLIYYDYIRWYNDEGSFIIFRYRLLYYHTEAWFWFWHWRAQGECLRVMCPPWKAWFFKTGIVQFAEYFRVQK